MKKNWVAILLAALISTMSLAGCIGNGDSDDAVSELEVEIDEKDDKITSLEAELANLTAQNSQAEADLAAAQAEIAAKQVELDIALSGLNSTQANASMLQSQIAMLENERDSVIEQSNELAEALSNLSDDSNETIQIMMNQIEQLNLEYNNISGILNESYMRLQENQTLLGQLQTLWLSKPLEITTFVYDIRCEGYADNTEYGYDDGDGNGTAFDGILHPDEVDGDLFRCIGGVSTVGFPSAESYYGLGADHVLIGSQLFFKTNYTLGDELYIYDITAGIQRLVKDIIPGSSGSAPTDLFEHQDIAYFTADDGGTYGRELWRSDGTSIGTYMVKDINQGSDSIYTSEFISVEDNMYFWADSALWKSDGTNSGTIKVFDLSSFGMTGYSSIRATDNGLLFWTAHTSNYGYEIWVSNGTLEGTNLLKDMNPSTGYASYTWAPYVVGSKIYFQANDGSGVAMYVSEGTEETTQLFYDNPGGSYYIHDITPVDNTSFYFCGNDGLNGYEPWFSDGTSNGTYLVKDVNPSGDSCFGGDKVVLDGKFVWKGNDGTHGIEPWVSDGTSNGTFMLADIWQGSTYTQFQQDTSTWIIVGEYIYFQAESVEKGLEIWITHLSTNTTTIVSDQTPSGDTLSQFIGYVNGAVFYIHVQPTYLTIVLIQHDMVQLGAPGSVESN